MYSNEIIKIRLNSLQNQINLLPKPQQFSLKLYSISESRFYVKHLLDKFSLIKRKNDSLTEKEAKELFYKQLKSDEYFFIQNEIKISKSNFLYWATHYAFIKSKLNANTEALMLFTPNIAQKIIHDVWSMSEELRHAVMMLYLKARQLGISTLNELAIAHRVQFYHHINSLVASSDPDKTKKMANMMKIAWENQPFWMLSNYVITASKEQWALFSEMDSSVTTQHGTAMSGVARGDTPDVFHLSELPDWSDPAEDVDAALLNAIHETPDTFGVLESTAKGMVGKGQWWYRKWKYAKKYFPLNKTRLRPVFLPYFIGTDLYPTQTWERQFFSKKIKSEYKPKPETIAHSIKAKQYVKESPLLKKYLGENWNLPIQQMYWWEFTRQEAEEENKLSKFLEEMPANDFEAFQLSGRGLLSPIFIEALRNRARPLATYDGAEAVFGIIGPGIPREFEPDLDEIDSTRPHIEVIANWASNLDPIKFRFIPLIHDPDKWERRFFVYEFPNTLKNEYATGVDCSEGLGDGDNSAIEIIRKGTVITQAEQVAEFCTAFMSATELLPFSLAIGTFYSFNNQDEVKQVCQVIELADGGRDLQHNLRKYGWSNFHRWSGSYDNFKRKTTTKIGWETNSWTRPMLISNCITAIKDGYFLVNSPHLINELQTLQKDSEDNQRIEAKGDDHDDRVFGAFISFFSLHDWEIYERNRGRLQGTFKSGERETEVFHTLNDSFEQVETKKVNYEDYFDNPIMNDILPTLEDEEMENITIVS